MSNYPTVPESRRRLLTSYDLRPEGDYVVYWMNAFRRPRYNFSLQRAVGLAAELKRPLIVVEALRTGYRWASDRFHRFIIDGMIDNEKHFASTSVTYIPFLETTEHSGHGMLESLCQKACLLVADDYPCFFHPVLYERIVSKWKVCVELVDSNGILPMRVADRTFTVAHSFRRYLQKELPKHLDDFPLEDPLRRIELPKLKKLPSEFTERWPAAKLADFSEGTENFERFAIDHSVLPTKTHGGFVSADKQMARFVEKHLDRYDEDRNVPDLEGASRLSPYLHFGHISAHEVFRSAMEHVNWKAANIQKPNGKSQGFWGATPQVEGFIDELVTWREIGFNMCHRERDFDRFESLPTWAKTTLKEHEKDKRVHIYSLDELERAKTSDSLWNAAQNELVREGRIHNYLRMLWGKNILGWTPNAKTALEYLIELNNKYALDGRDPNSYSGIFWVLGRYDRAWGPERKVFGKIRYMTSESTRRKFPMKEYLRRFA